MKRALFALFLWLAALLPTAALANDVLVLMEPVTTGVHAPPGSESRVVWVRWPLRNGATGNQLLSLVTGADWRGDPADYRFRVSGANEWQADNLAAMRSRGHFVARERHIRVPTIAVTASAGIFRDVLLLAVGQEGRVRPLGLKDRWPQGSLAFCKARGWQELAAIEGATDGRVLVVEYPPPGGGEFGRAWLRGRGWPVWRSFRDRGVEEPYVPVYLDPPSIPGYFQARDLTDLFLHRSPVEWERPRSQGWPDLQPWIDYARDVGYALRAILGVGAAILLIWGLRLVADERRSRTFARCLIPFLLVIPATSLAGEIARASGPGAFFGTGALAISGLFVVTTGVNGLVRRFLPHTHPLWGIAIVAAATVALTSPIYSAFSGPFGSPMRDFSPEPIGALMVAGVVLIAGAGEGRFTRGFGRGMILFACVAGVSRLFWWQASDFVVAGLPLVSWIACDRRFRPWMVALVIPFTGGMLNLIQSGVTYRPGGLVGRLSDWGAFDMSVIVRFAISPAVLGTVLALICGLVFLPSFAAHQLRRAWRRSPLCRPLATLGAALGILGVFQAPLLDVAYIVAAAAVLVLLLEAVWTAPDLV
ncbi:MAG: hypothetical protein ACO1SV_06640 [Fimbriimonas sp.]